MMSMFPLPASTVIGRMAADHLWQSTVILVLAWLLTLALRSNRAAVRHGIWVAASLKFLVPLVVFVHLGHQLGTKPSAAKTAPLPLVTFVDALSQPFSQPSAGSASIVPVATAGAFPGVPVLLSVWLVGSGCLVAGAFRRWRRIRIAVDHATPISNGPEIDALRRLEQRGGVGKPIELVASDGPLEPGVFGVTKPVLLWPRRISEHLDQAHLETILAHEVSHVRRRDNFFAALHMAVEVVFWFHPLVWWVGSRLVDERERACDEEVIGQGHPREAYAEGILKTCALYVEAPLACVSGVTGADLRRRIEQIMKDTSIPRLTIVRKLLLAASAGLTLVGPIAYGIVNAPPALAQTTAVAPETMQLRRKIEMRLIDRRLHADAEARIGQAQLPSPPTLSPRPAFDVTSVKPNKSGTGRIMMLQSPAAGWTATNVTLGMLVRLAFQLQDSQIVGGPKWLFSERFDVTGKGSAPGGDGPLMPKLQALLADRFKLEVHTETRELPIYALMPARRDGNVGPDLRTSTLNCPAASPSGRHDAPPPPPPPPPRPGAGATSATGDAFRCGFRFGPGTLSGGGADMSQLARNLSQIVGALVVDRTGLSGQFDWNLKYAPDPSLGGRGDLPPLPPGAAPPVIDAPSIFTALQEQLGLKLDSRKGPVDVLVIDRADQPKDD